MSQTKYRSLAYPDCIQMHFRKSGQQKTTWNMIFFFCKLVLALRVVRGTVPSYLKATVKLYITSWHDYCDPLSRQFAAPSLRGPCARSSWLKFLSVLASKCWKQLTRCEGLLTLSCRHYFLLPFLWRIKCTSCLTHNKFYLAELKATLCCHFALTMCSLQDSRWGKVRNSERRTQFRA